MISTKEISHLSNTLKIAEKSEFKRARMACIAVYRHKIVATGMNSHKTHPMQEKYNQFRTDFDESGDAVKPKIHAEMSCIAALASNTNIRYDEVTLYVARSCKDKPHGMARPCNACMQAIKDLGIKRVVYTTDFGYADEQIL